MNKVIVTSAIVAWIIFAAFKVADTVKGSGNVTHQTYAVSGFEKISSGGSANIFIDQNGIEGVEIETDDNLQPYITVEVEKGVLNIRMKSNADLRPTKLNVHVSCKHLSAINTGGSGDISTKSKLAGNELHISNGGSGDYKINVEVKTLQINSGGSGSFNIKGTAGSFEFIGAGSGDIKARELTAAATKIVTSGSGDVILKKGTIANVTSVGSGVVSYE